MMAVTRLTRTTEGEPRIDPLEERQAQVAKLGVVPAANAVTVVAVAAYLICAAVAFVSIDLVIGFFQPWFHGLSLAAMRPAATGFRPDAFVVGLVTFAASAWLATAATAALYNALARR
jgi:hypothetical protein